MPTGTVDGIQSPHASVEMPMVKESLLNADEKEVIDEGTI